MPDTRAERLEALFDEAAELDIARRAEFLAARCGDDTELRVELERLLARDASARADRSITPRFDPEGHHDTLSPGAVISDRYTLVRRLGAGGMGVVWLAVQATPRREVALKVIRPGLLSRSMLRRFALEAAVLGRLQHPGIAQIHEAGTYDDGSGGRPFFAMELVEGTPLLAYVGDAHATTRQRLELFARICDAVQHAHQKGVIHRDLKPGNILVTGDGQPKILDFGVARATDGDLQVSTIQTNVGQLVGTLPYMSPEQVTGRSDQLDTRSDVYALGVILYQLLSDRLPYELDNRNITAAARVIAEEEPTPLTTIHRSFRGDLNTIALKALEKSPLRRYQSASDLAADVRRYLGDEPIVARPASTIYNLRKFARRNKGLVAGVAAAFIILIGGVIGTTIAMVRARDAAARATAINDFMSDLIVSADPQRGRADVSMVEALRAASDTVSQRFAVHPDVEADVRELLARAFHNLKQTDEELKHARREYELREAIGGFRDRATRGAGLRYVQALMGRFDIDAARSVAGQVLENTPEGERTGETALELRRIIANSHTVRRENDQAIAQLRGLLPIARESLGAGNATVVAIMGDLAWGLVVGVVQRRPGAAPGDVDEAIGLYRGALVQLADVDGGTGADTFNVMLNLAEALRMKGEMAEASQLALQVVDAAQPRYGADHQFNTRALRNLCDIRYLEGRLDEAADYRIRAIESTRRRERGVGMETISVMGDGLEVLDAADRLAEGEAYSRVLYERFDAMGSRFVQMATSNRLFLARFLSRQGKFEEAREHFSPLMDGVGSISNPSLVMRIHQFYGAHLVERGEFQEAEKHLLEAMRLREQPSTYARNSNAKPPSARHEPIEDVIRLYERWNRPGEAEAWRAKRITAPAAHS